MGLSLSFFVLIYVTDFINGGSAFFFRPARVIQDQVGKSIFREVYKDVSIYNKNYLPINQIENFLNDGEKKSISYQAFEKSYQPKEALIILESWGLPLNHEINSYQHAMCMNLDTPHYSIKFDSSLFNGGTSQAEARELLNKKGEAYYSSVANGDLGKQGLVKLAYDNHQTSIALQSFMGSYSNGKHFRENIGFDYQYDYKYFSDSLHYSTTHNNHYLSVNDEDVVKHGFGMANRYPGVFIYILTINTHLPFRLEENEKASSGYRTFKSRYATMFPSDESLDQQYKISQQLAFISRMTAMYDLDRVVVIGDHPPPFLLPSERKMYSSKYVPALMIEKK